MLHHLALLRLEWVMSNSGSSIYYATDKNISDVLNQKNVTVKHLKSFLEKKGIIVAAKARKESLIEYIRAFLIDYDDRLLIMSVFGSNEKKEKTTHKVLKTELEDASILEALNDVKKMYAVDDESINISQNSDGEISVTLRYTEVDFKKTELQQRRTKNITLNISNHNNQIKIQSPATEKASMLIEDLKGHLLEKVDEDDIEEKIISLEGITSPEKRTQFFVDLISNMNDYKVHDVKSVSISHTQDDSVDLSNTAFINKVVLNGHEVMSSPEFKDLNGRGFYISKLTWLAKDKNDNEGDHYEFESEFTDQINCTGFRYSCKCFYQYNESLEEYTLTKHKLTKFANKQMVSLLENSANIAYQNAIDTSSSKDA